MLHRQDRLIAVVLVVGDLACTFGALALAYVMRFVWKLAPNLPDWTPSFADYLPFALAIMVTLVAVFAANGLYSRRRGHSNIEEFLAVLRISFLVLVVAYGVTIFWRVSALSRWLLAFFWVLDVVFITVFRLLVDAVARRVRRMGVDTRKALVIGAGGLAEQVVERLLDHPEYGYEVTGYIAEEAVDAGRLESLEYLGGFNELTAVLERNRPDEVFIALSRHHNHRLLAVLDLCEREGVNASIVPDFFEVLLSRSIQRTQLEDMDGIPVVGLREVPLHSLWNRFVKRAFDFIVSLLFILVFSWLYVLVAAGVALTSKGPAIFKQRRVGRDLEEFTLYKFRTMYVQSESSSDTVWTKKDDPRVTPFGRFLRRTSLDEIPQFFNVLKGDMSIVGPRPERPHFVEQFKESVPRFQVRHQVKAGITGWAQVNGRYELTIPQKVEYDIYYIENWSFWLDLRIIFMTIFRVIGGRDAY
ncbi:MAG: undecaprenyl-phosphate glucose phosphotransferase [Candidatus Coatesbacteria bacterium]|nr:undecaprenyl-phosphate glucose phosphotransferase [Candidatus Coatesbacteria bacterium]